MRLARVFFKKADRGIYISHLDLNRAMQRAIKRSRLPVWYTQGYNPHMYLTFALPLSLGFEGVRESMDLKILGEESNEEIAAMLKKAFPPCIELIEVCDPVMDSKEIGLADYEIVFSGNQKVLAEMQSFSALEEILIEKKSKKGMNWVNIAPMFSLQEGEVLDEQVKVVLRVAAGNNLNLNPTLILSAFSEHLGTAVDFDTVRRIAILTEDGQEWA